MLNFSEKNKKSGIYQIKNLNSGKVYIGSAFNLCERFNCHKSLLKNNKHGNKYLQNSYNKNSDRFIFEVIEYVDDISKIYEIEQFYIDRNYGINCYNISKKTNNYTSLFNYNEDRKKKFKLIDSENNIYEFSGYVITANLLNLNFRLLRNLVIGKSKSYKGFRLPENINYDFKNYRKVNGRRAKLHDIKLISPYGKIYGPIFNIEEFCRTHLLVASGLRHLISGKNKSHKGWRIIENNKLKNK